MLLVGSRYMPFGVALFLLCEMSFALSAEVPNLDQLIESIAQHEELLQEISAQHVVTIPEKATTFVEAEWGYSHGREFKTGTMYLNVAEIGIVAKQFQFAFGGDRMRIYALDPLNNRHTGRITNLEPVNFTGYPTLNTLLGHERTQKRQAICLCGAQAGRRR